jgi:L-lactate dehydrogenase complex protein LldG
MTTRERILQAVAQNKPERTQLPDLTELAQVAHIGFADDRAAKFTDTLTGIGGQVRVVSSLADVERYIVENYTAGGHRVVSTLPELAKVAELDWPGLPVHRLADAELAVIQAQFGVVENGAVWLTEPLLLHRATPFIAQHLAVVLAATDLVPTMHAAYARIGAADYDFGVFVAGPSKTADIEQSLVLGAHGPKTMTVFLLA